MRFPFWLAAIFAAFIGLASPCNAQATRTWVSGVGDDANPCSRTAPCKTFPGAISKTAAGGEISVLDPGGFGALTITKSISLVADGNEGSILNALTSGITINAGVNDVISIKGIKIEGAGSGLNGIRVIQAGSVYISDVFIRGNKGSPGTGVDIASSSAVRVYMRNVEINNNITGIHIGGTGANTAFIDRCTVEANTTNALKMDTSTAAAAIYGSSLTGSAVVLSNGAVLNSFGNNVIPQGTPNGSLMFK